MIYQVGSSGAAVKDFQERLDQWGFPLKLDGIFGSITLAAVKEFQKAMGLKVDGIIGPNTEASLKKAVIKVTHFKKEEFKCRCEKYCEGYLDASDRYGGISYALLLLLERIRAEVARQYGQEIPCHIAATGGYRCEKYNKLVGGARRSYHLFGKAADIFFGGVPVSVVNKIAKKMNPYGGIGLNGASITHVDVRGYTSKWYYN